MSSDFVAPTRGWIIRPSQISSAAFVMYSCARWIGLRVWKPTTFDHLHDGRQWHGKSQLLRRHDGGSVVHDLPHEHLHDRDCGLPLELTERSRAVVDRRGTGSVTPFRLGSTRAPETKEGAG